MSTSCIDNGVVVVTGASSGIGHAIAQRIASRAREIVLVARRTERLEELAGELKAVNPTLVTHVCGCDLGDGRARDAFIAELCRNHPEIDVLVNCAGFGDLGVFDMCGLEKQIAMIDLNVTALVALTHAVLPAMVSRRRGAILMVSSGFGLSFMPGLATYVGTKHFVTGFTETLRLDLAGTGVYVGQVCPGPVKTEFAERTGNFTGRDVPDLFQISADKCADVCVRTIDKRKALVVPHVLIWLAVWLAQKSPRFLTRLVLSPLGKQLRKLETSVKVGTSSAR